MEFVLCVVTLVLATMWVRASRTRRRKVSRPHSRVYDRPTVTSDQFRSAHGFMYSLKVIPRVDSRASTRNIDFVFICTSGGCERSAYI